MTKSKINILIWVVAIGLVFAALYVTYSKGKLNKVQDEQTQKLAPDFALEDINGKKVTLSDYRGKIVVLNFWATWCPYCVDEMSDLNEVNKELEKREDAVFFAINEGESKEVAKRYLDENNLNMPVLMDFDSRVGMMYGASSIPITVFINKDGTGYGYIGGATNKETIMKVIDEMNQ